MLFEIFKFELKYRAKRIDTYLFFGILFLFSLVAFNFIFEGQNIGLVKDNAPFITARIMAVVSGIFMVIISMVMGVPILRDFEYHFESLLFVNPIKKRDYLLGRFLGSFVVLVFIFSALIWGLLLGEFMPWRDADNLLPIHLWTYVQPFLTLVIPTLFFAGSIFFVSGAWSRNLIVVYTQGVLFFVLFIFSQQLENPLLAGIIEPFGLSAISRVVETWSLAERNAQLVPMTGVLLFNRIVWLIIGVSVLAGGYFAFNFNVVKKESVKKGMNLVEDNIRPAQKEIQLPNVNLHKGWLASWEQLRIHSIFYFKSIFQQVSFWSILICGVVIIFINSINLGTAWGVNSFPTTYLIVEELQESSIFFFLIILVFYSGELIWKERGATLNLIYDALPVSDFILLAGKFIGLVLIYVFLLSALILAGILFQTLNGYYDYELPVYFTGFFLEIFPFLLLYTFISFFIQVICNAKFTGYLLVLVFFLLTMAMDIMEFGHPLIRFGSGSLGKYSDMNGYGHFMFPYLSFQFYWACFGAFLFIIAAIFMIRGTETGWKKRWTLSQQRWSSTLTKLAVAVIAIFALTGSTIFYNTNVLNDYWSRTEKETFQANYEKTLKNLPTQLQPKLVAVNLEVELYPADRDYTAAGYYIFTNVHDQAINTLHVQKWVDQQITLDYLEFEGGATVDSSYAAYEYYGFHLNKPLVPGDSIKLFFQQQFITQGFVASNSSIRIVHNGIFLDNHHLPMLGYNYKFELKDEGDRKKYGLPPRETMAKKEDASPQDLYAVDDYEVDLEIIVGTDADQTAIAPGNLVKKWSTDQRNYFHYKMDQPMMNLYSVNSGRYEILQDSWTSTTDPLATEIPLEIYYHRGHEVNLQRMMDAMKSSLDYFDQHFSPYQYSQMRIIEFPRYIEFAQSFPNMIPFSEALGFILNIDDTTGVDIAFFVTAHELAHQWWGHQVTVDNRQGWGLIIESLAQYSALMVLQEKYPEQKIEQFLRKAHDKYFQGRSSDSRPELALDEVEKQEYVYYDKGLINLFALQDYISEEKVNLALNRFIKDWNVTDGPLKTDRYPASEDLLDYFRAVTPDSLQYIITDLFETITLYDNSIAQFNYEKIAAEEFKVNLKVAAQKYRVDSLGLEMAIGIADWIDVGVYGLGKNGEEELIYLEKHWIRSADQELEIFVKRPPIKAGIDPLGKLMDKDLEDNVVGL